MSYGKDLAEQFENYTATLELEARYMRERKDRKSTRLNSSH